MRTKRLGMLAVVLLLVLGACVRTIDRPNPAQTSPVPSTSSHTPTATFEAAPTVAPTHTPTPTFTPTPEIENTPVPTPTYTPFPVPTNTSTPTRTATPVQSPGPLLNVIGPTNGSTVLHNSIVVFGTTNIGATVSVNGLNAPVDETGRFQREIDLVQGNNPIEVVASDGEGGQRVVNLEVVSLALPPLPLFLIVTEPQDQSIVSSNPVRLSGRTSPDAIVSVKGVSVTVDPIGIFSTNLTLEQGPNIIDVVANDTKGEVRSAVIAIIYRP